MPAFSSWATPADGGGDLQQAFRRPLSPLSGHRRQRHTRDRDGWSSRSGRTTADKLGRRRHRQGSPLAADSRSQHGPQGRRAGSRSPSRCRIQGAATAPSTRSKTNQPDSGQHLSCGGGIVAHQRPAGIAAPGQWVYTLETTAAAGFVAPDQLNGTDTTDSGPLIFRVCIGLGGNGIHAGFGNRVRCGFRCRRFLVDSSG